uniref:CCHC-type domain-containing protein n=1 Tax=Mycena chlorophos TaxID=658473 RepID=A0ABQ0KX73_MYCCL|nr:predicted protein [Mycena chlorophos]
MSEEDILQKAATILRDTDSSLGPSFRLHGAVKLADGRVALKACTEAEAGKIRKLGDDWVTALADGMQVSRPSYPVIIHGVPAEFDPGSAIATSVLHNSNKMFISEVVDIRNIRRLYGNSDRYISKTAYSLVLTLGTQDAANASVLGKICRTERFVQPPPQCYHCQAWNHISSVCPKRNDTSSLACARCSKNHNTKTCSCPHSPQCTNLRSCTHIVAKCANCHGPHKSFDNECPVKQQCLTAHRAQHDLSGCYFGDFDPSAPVRAGGRDL